MRVLTHRPKRRLPIRRGPEDFSRCAQLEASVPPAACVLTIRNRQRTRPVDLRWLRQIARELVRSLPQVSRIELGVFLVADGEMIRTNEHFLHHAGTTDVITFDYSELGARNPELKRLHGEIFVCVDEALRQARRFRTSWQSEIVRYLVHGVLHLLGYDDSRPAARRRMKREENRRLRQLTGHFALSRLARKPRLAS